jgi:CubicO group peptidase (beta-lactamase class C family)
MTARSSVGLGSLTKSFTALAVLQLVEQGRVQLDDPVVRHLPWFRTADEAASQRITLRMLLSNSSGLPSLDSLWFGDLDTSDEALERLVRSLRRYRSQREPGTSFEYSNEGWAVLGVLVQQLSGESYSTYLQQRVLDPLAMQRSTTELARFDAIGALHGHTAGPQGFAPARPHYQAVVMPAGSMLHASAEDLGHYLIALLDGGVYQGQRVLSEPSVAMLWTPVISAPGLSVDDGGTGEPVSYALGWMVDTIDGRVVVHHSGSMRTMSTETYLEPGTRSGAAILVNADTLDPYRWPPLRTLANNLLHLANGEPLSDFGIPRRRDPTRNDYELPAELVARYQGTFLDPAGNRLDLVGRDGLLHATLLSGGLETRYTVDFTSEAGLVLRNVSESLRGSCVLSPAGRVTAVVLGGMVAGGSFRRMASARGEESWTTSANRSIAFALPPGWAVQWDGDRFEASQRAVPARRLRGGWSTSSPPAPDPTGAVVHVETQAGRSWRELVWTDHERGDSSQHLQLVTRVGVRRFELVATAPEGQLTELTRDAVNGVVRGICLSAESGCP